VEADGRRLLMLKHGLVLVAALLAAAVSASSASALAPIKSQYTVDNPVVIGAGDLCGFSVALSQHATITEIDFLGQSGGLTRIFVHVREQDTFSANGITLTGVPYSANQTLVLDEDGNVVSAFAEGVFENVPLPNGGAFFSAGRANALGKSFALFPDVGVSGDTAALCAALTP
jgi:hypothetical protein